MKLRSLAVLSSFAIAASAAVTSHSADACTTAAMSYYGGKIDANPRVVYVFWGLSSTDLATAQSIADPVLATKTDSTYGLAGTKWWDTLEQYNGAIDRQSGTMTAPSNPDDILYPSDVIDNHNPPRGALTDAQIDAEVDYLVKNNKIPGMTKDTIILMFLPSTATPPEAFCGRHMESAGGNLYAWISFPGTVAGCDGPWMDQAIGHEIVEAVLNPEWNRSTQGWTQGDASCEIGDLCESFSFEVQTQPPYNLTQTQPYWSNEAVSKSGAGCVYARASHAFLFGFGTDAKLYMQPLFPWSTVSMGMQNWISWGSGKNNTVSFSGKPGAASWGRNRFDAFALDTTGQMWHAWSENNGGSASWEPRDTLPAGVHFMPQYVESWPDAVTWGPGDIQVFAFADDFNLYRDAFDQGTGWTGWKSISLPAGHEFAWSNISVASAMATNTNGGYPRDVHTVNLAYIDTNNQIIFGSLSRGSTTPTWTTSGVPFQAWDLDIAIWAPGRTDVFVRDRDGNLWDCVSTDQVHVGTCYEWGHPADGTFDATPGVVGLGDGRLLVADRVGGNGHEAAYFSMWDFNGSSAWYGYNYDQPNGTFIGGIDVAAW